MTSDAVWLFAILFAPCSATVMFGILLLKTYRQRDEAHLRIHELEAEAKALRGFLRAERRADILTRAEAKLADCGIVGIMDEFEDIPDAIEQMALYIKDLESRPASQSAVHPLDGAA